jgi:hypothetical protein
MNTGQQRTAAASDAAVVSTRPTNNGGKLTAAALRLPAVHEPIRRVMVNAMAENVPMMAIVLHGSTEWGVVNMAAGAVRSALVAPSRRWQQRPLHVRASASLLPPSNTQAHGGLRTF